MPNKITIAELAAQLVNAKTDDEVKRIKRAIANKKQSLARAERDAALRSIGLTKVRGPVSGKIYWE